MHLLFISASSIGLILSALGFDTEQMNSNSLQSCCTHSDGMLGDCVWAEQRRHERLETLQTSKHVHR